MFNTKIIAIDFEVAQTSISNDDLSKILDTSDEWIYTRTGIKERRLVSGDESAVDLGIDAARKALEKSGIKPEDIEISLSELNSSNLLLNLVLLQLQVHIHGAMEDELRVRH